MIPLDAARQRIAELVPPGARTDTVALADALGQCLAQDLVLDQDAPVTDRSFMDGFAVCAADLQQVPVELAVVGESRAGVRFSGTVPRGAAVRIMTGATLPPGADAVVRVEDTSGFAGARVVVKVAVAPGTNIRRRGHDGRAGDLVLARGTRIGPAQVGALAACGRDPVPVFGRPQVAVLPTGDEIVPVTEVPGPDQVRNSNTWALRAQLLELGAVPRVQPIVRDDAAALHAAVGAALRDSDFVLTIGGVSAGIHDLVGQALTAHGVSAVFHGVAVKPGKPTWFGVRRTATGAVDRWVFGLPGNPASCFTMFAALVQAALRRFMGDAQAGAPADTGRIRGRALRADSRLQLLPARLRQAADGVVLEPVPPGASSNVFPVAAGNVLLQVPAGQGAGDGDVVHWQPY